MSWLWLLFYIVLVVIVINLFFIYNEKKQQRFAWPYPSSYDDMINIAKKKKDHEMDDEEFNLKFAPFRHEASRAALFGRKSLDKANIILHYIELYLLHGGPARLKKKYPIKEAIFIIGDFRSGTSVLERLIAHHPDVVYFEMGHQLLWAAPWLWSKFLGWMGFIRANVLGHAAWNSPYSKGIFYPHSSNVLLHRCRPFEIEILWESCKRNLLYHRNHKWDTLDDINNNSDNNCNLDIIDEHLNDKQFELILKNAIRLLLANSSSKNPRFIWKNPLNGYRLRYLYKLFPNAKFIHIARNPLKTTLSQIRMQETNLRVCFLNDNECRVNDNKPPPKDSVYSWNKLYSNQYPNDLGTLWFPRIFPRTKPEYYEITKFIKKDKMECAVATAVNQQERITVEAFNSINAIEGVNKLTVWHEDVLEDATLTYEKVMDYLGLKCTKKQRLEWLEREDFPGGQANRSRVKKSNKTEKQIDFGKHTKEVTDIIQNGCAMKRYKTRESIKSK